MTERPSEQWFERVRQNADQVLRVRQRAQSVLAQRSAERFDGFGHLLGKVVPAVPEQLQQIAEALGVGPALVAQLRASELDPVHMPPSALVVLGQVLGLTEDVFFELVWRDHERFVQLEQGTLLPRGRDKGQFGVELRDAWERAALDDPTIE